MLAQPKPSAHSAMSSAAAYRSAMDVPARSGLRKSKRSPKGMDGAPKVSLLLVVSMSAVDRLAEVHAEPGQRQRLDSPCTVNLLVGLVIMAVAVHLLAVRPAEHVFHPPDAGGSRLRCQLDLRRVAVMHRENVADCFPQEHHVPVRARHEVPA